MAPDHRIKVSMVDLDSQYDMAIPVFRSTVPISMSLPIIANLELMSNGTSLKRFLSPEENTPPLAWQEEVYF